MNIRHGPLACLLAMLVAGCSPTSGESTPTDQQQPAMAVDEAVAPARNATEAAFAAMEMAGGRAAEGDVADGGVAGGTTINARPADTEMSGARTTDANMTDGEAAGKADAPIPPGPVERPADTLLPATRPDRIAPVQPDRARPGPLDLPPSNAAAQDDAPFPDEVTAFMVDRDGCDHFRGEEPYDADRRAYLENSIAQLCTGTDAKLAALRRLYSGNPAVIAALSAYEDRIEEPEEGR